MSIAAEPNIDFVSGYVPGVIGRLAEMHGTYYHRHWKFGVFFEAKVACELCGFLTRYDPDRDGLWTASAAGRIEGSVVIDAENASTQGAHLRW